MQEKRERIKEEEEERRKREEKRADKKNMLMKMKMGKVGYRCNII